METIIAKAKQIKLLILDVDGVMTDGSVHIDNNGNQYMGFSIQDGLGIKLLQKTGIAVALITGRQSNLVTIRAKMLGISYVYQGNINKRTAFAELCDLLTITKEQIAYVGDDLPDLALIQQAGLGIAVANAVPLVKEHACWQTKATGGKGAVREVCDFIMQAQGTWESITREFYA